MKKTRKDKKTKEGMRKKEGDSCEGIVIEQRKSMTKVCIDLTVVTFIKKTLNPVDLKHRLCFLVSTGQSKCHTLSLLAFGGQWY